MIAWTEHVQGGLALVDGDVDTAVAKLSQSFGEFRALREPIYSGMMHSFLGYAYRIRGELELARACFVEELQVGVDTGAPAHPGLGAARDGHVYVDAGLVQRAASLIAAVVQCYGFVAESPWFLEIAGAEYRAAMAALSPEQIEEAKQAVLLSDMRTEATGGPGGGGGRHRAVSPVFDGICSMRGPTECIHRNKTACRSKDRVVPCLSTHTVDTQGTVHATLTPA